jgi:hypothetical protein
MDAFSTFFVWAVPGAIILLLLSVYSFSLRKKKEKQQRDVANQLLVHVVKSSRPEL